MKVSVIIPAAGRSERFGETDKLAQDLGGRPVLVRTVEIFTKHDAVGSIIVAGPPEDDEAYTAFRERYAPTLGFHGAMVVGGGAVARWETVQRALAAVPDDATHIAVHDAARPAVSPDLLQRLFEAAESVPAVIPAVTVRGTVKRVQTEEVEVERDDDDVVADLILGDAGKERIMARPVVETIERTGLVEVQTPQVFDADLLRRAYAQADLDGATDDATVVERLGETVHVVEGDPTNVKITVSADLPLVRAILGLSAPKERPAHKRF